MYKQNIIYWKQKDLSKNRNLELKIDKNLVKK